LAPGLKSLEDALEIRQRVLSAFEVAERETDPVARNALLTYFLIGFENRILVLIRWAWAYLTFQRGSRLITHEPEVNFHRRRTAAAGRSHAC
jgi:NADH dehydrogenase FAD-containing subunit